MNKSRTSWMVLALASACGIASLPSDLSGQGGGRGGGRRGPPQEVRERWGNYFTTTTLGEPDAKGKFDDLSKSEHIAKTTAAGELAILYVFDSTVEPEARQRFEQVLLNHGKVNPGLRLFHCARVDIADNKPAQEDFGKHLPVFIVFNKSGEEVSRVVMKGYKPAPVPLTRAMSTATRGYGKTSFDKWVKDYSKFLRESTNLDARKKMLDSKRERIEKKGGSSQRKKLADLNKEQAALDKEINDHYASETKLLEKAKVPQRETGAVLVGEPSRGRGR